VQRKLIFRDYRRVEDLTLPFDVEVIEKGSPTVRSRYETIVELADFDPDWLRVPDPARRFIPAEELSF